MDRSRRNTNPEFFNSKGEIIRIDQLPSSLVDSKRRRKWKCSCRYKELQRERIALFGLQTEQRELSHRTLINQLVTCGDTHYIEKMNFAGLAKRSKADKTKSGKNRSTRRFGRSIANRAPGKLVALYQIKVELLGGTFSEINTRKAKASQYNHMSGLYKKKKLSQRWNHMPNGDRIQRDLYSAFLIQHILDPEAGTYNDSLLVTDYIKFKSMHDQVMTELTGCLPSSIGMA